MKDLVDFVQLTKGKGREDLRSCIGNHRYHWIEKATSFNALIHPPMR